MQLESLLLSRDPEIFRVLRPALEKLTIDVEVCQDARKASEIIISEKFDAVLIDCDDVPGAREVLQGLRATASNRNSVTFAILNGQKTSTQEAFSMGVNFVLQKPISPVNAARCLNAALNFMVRERRRYFRQPVKMLVRVMLGEKELRATSTNVSEGGIALMFKEALPRGVTPRLQFTLPETDLPLELETELAWADLKGRAGFRFLSVPQSSVEQLERWLNRRMEKEFPGSAEALVAASPGQ